jgi:hypothetical protein
MKLVIDIPDSDYERIKDLVADDTGYTTATTIGTAYQVIANGLPYEERPQGEFAEKLKDRIEERVCKYCQMNKHCELCEISRVFQIITLTTEEQRGGAV